MDVENSNSIHSDLIRGHINTIILNILYENDRYGYEILQQIEIKSNGQYILKQPTLYSALKRLEQLDFVTSYWGSGMSNGGRRKYFQITDKGREFVQQNRAEWEYSRTIIDNLVSDKIFDFDKNTAPANIDFTALKKRQPRAAFATEEDTTDGVEQRYAQQIEKDSSAYLFGLQADNFLQPIYTTDFIETPSTTPCIEDKPLCNETSSPTSIDTTTEQILQSVAESNTLPQESTLENSTVAVDTATEQILQSVAESNTLPQESTLENSTVAVDTTTEQILQSVADSNTLSQEPALENSTVAIDTATEQILQSVAESNTLPQESTLENSTVAVDTATEQILQSVAESNTLSQEPALENSTVTVDTTTEQILQSVAESNTISQEPTLKQSTVAVDTTTEQILQSVAESNTLPPKPTFDNAESSLPITMPTQQQKVWHRDTGYTTSSTTKQNSQNRFTSAHTNEPIDIERMKIMHENYLKLIGDFEALQTQYIYTMLENENPNFSKMHTKHTPYTDSSNLAFDYRNLENLSLIPYTSDTVWASSVQDDSIYLEEVPTKDYMQENVLEQLPPTYLETTIIEEEIKDKYTNLDTSAIYNSLQEEVIENSTHPIEDTEFIYDVLEDDENLKRKKAKKRTWFVHTSYSKLFVSISSFLFVLALIECLTVFFIGTKLNVNYQFALSVAILYTIVYILSTLLASRENSKQTLIAIAQKKYMWYTLLCYGIALIVSVVTLYLLTKTFESMADFWFYTLSFNIFTLNIPLLSIIYCWCVSLKHNAKKDTL